MAVIDIDKLLALPHTQRRKIAKQLWESLAHETKSEQKVISLLEKRWQNIRSGKTKLINADTFWKNIELHLQQKAK